MLLLSADLRDQWRALLDIRDQIGAVRNLTDELPAADTEHVPVVRLMASTSASGSGGGT
jgi:hypothetical protein